MSKYRRMVFTSIQESCKSKLPASGNATWMQGSVKVPVGEVYALPAKRPLTRLAIRQLTDHPLPKGEGGFNNSHAHEKRQPSPRGEGARRRRAGEGFLPIQLGFEGIPCHIVR
jgi:hypothetical protein